jgi:hypothetical protein
MDNYEYKYLKYKYKYLQLQLGGLNKKNKNRNSWVEVCGRPLYDPSMKDYFEGVDIDVKTKKHLWLLLFMKFQTKLVGFKFIKKIILDELLKLNNNIKKESWIKCKNECFKKLKGFMDSELTSTAYILRILVASVIQSGDSNINLRIIISPGAKLTGTWEDDKKYILLKELEDNKKPRLIMGFGPSASGKTYWAESIIKILSSDKSFPKAFLSIDGGIYREKSVIYQLIIKIIKKLCNKKILGFENLYSSGFENLKGNMKSLFKSPKKNIREYLKSLSKNNVKLSLYVPETAGSCLQCRVVLKKCKCAEKIVSKYIKISGDKNWIGLFIWQHLNNSDCKFSDDSKCKSTSASGKSRELDEGKKFSPMAYKFSFNGGLATMKRAPGGRIEIHNGGGLKYKGKFTKTTMKEYGERLLHKIDLSEYNSNYVDKKFNMHH